MSKRRVFARPSQIRMCVLCDIQENAGTWDIQRLVFARPDENFVCMYGVTSRRKRVFEVHRDIQRYTETCVG